jgi:23S rRNA pseudouridine1911/1915/1917 synthase
MSDPATFTVCADVAGQSLAAALRRFRPGLSWSAAKRLITTRRVAINGTLCLNDARRLKEGERIALHEEPQAPLPREKDIRILHVDPDLIVIDKPAGIVTLRRDEERDFTEQRKQLTPTLDELLPRLLPGGPRLNGGNRKSGFPLYAVHRLDRDTSGLMLFALSPRSRDILTDRFSRHQIDRTYRAVCLGRIEGAMTITTRLVRNRGDGLRGSTDQLDRDDAQLAVTHVRPLEHPADGYTVLECRLETGRTHQIRIHLAEIGHMICGEKLYTRPAPNAPVTEDPSGAPRQALHSCHLRLEHPITGRVMEFDSPWPRDLASWLARLKTGGQPA